MKDNPCYVYAILPRETPIPPALTGLGNAPLAAIDCRALAAVVSPLEPAALSPTPAFLLGHEAVVEALCQAGPALPVRFGTVLAGPEAVAHALAEQYDTLHADLARVGQKVELGLTILWSTAAEQNEAPNRQQALWTSDTPANRTPGVGTRYMQARIAQYQREAALQHKASTLIAHLEQALRAHTVEQRYRILLTPRLTVRAACLVNPDQIEACHQNIEAACRAYPEVHWLISGPWPPYNFVTGAGKPFQQRPGPELDSARSTGGTL